MDEELIKSKVAKASGANYGFHKEVSKPMPAPEPVVSESETLGKFIVAVYYGDLISSISKTTGTSPFCRLFI